MQLKLEAKNRFPKNGPAKNKAVLSVNVGTVRWPDVAFRPIFAGVP